MKNWRKLVCMLVLAMIFSSLLDELRSRRLQSPKDWKAWIEWRDTYIPAANARNVACTGSEAGVAAASDDCS